MKKIAQVILTKLEKGWYHYDVVLSDGSIRKINGWSLRSDDAAARIGDELYREQRRDVRLFGW